MSKHDDMMEIALTLSGGQRDDIRHTSTEQMDNFQTVGHLWWASDANPHYIPGDLGETVPVVLLRGTYIDGMGYNSSTSLATRRWVETEGLADVLPDEALVTFSFGFGGEELGVRVDKLLGECWDEWETFLTDTWGTARDYFLGEDLLGEIESEIFDECFDAYLGGDLLSEVSEDEEIEEMVDDMPSGEWVTIAREALCNAGPQYEGESVYFDKNAWSDAVTEARIMVRDWHDDNAA